MDQKDDPVQQVHFFVWGPDEIEEKTLWIDKMWENLTYPAEAFWCRKWYLISMCLNLACSSGSFARMVAPPLLIEDSLGLD